MPPCGRVGRVLCRKPESGRRLAPDALQVLAHRIDSLVVKPVQTPVTFGPVYHEPGKLQQAEMPRYRRPADRQRVRKLPNGPVAGVQQLDDSSPIRVAERFEGLSVQRLARHPHDSNWSVTVT